MPTNNHWTLSIVVLAYNEDEVLPAFHQRLTEILGKLDCASEILYVNDGSSDTTLEVMKSFRDPRVAVIDLSRKTTSCHWLQKITQNTISGA